MTMIEKVALAIQGAKINGQRQRLTDDYANAMARAAIEAMREPTEAMLYHARHDSEIVSLPDEENNEVWQAMIGAALSHDQHKG